MSCAGGPASGPWPDETCICGRRLPLPRPPAHGMGWHEQVRQLFRDACAAPAQTSTALGGLGGTGHSKQRCSHPTHVPPANASRRCSEGLGLGVLWQVGPQLLLAPPAAWHAQPHCCWRLPPAWQPWPRNLAQRSRPYDNAPLHSCRVILLYFFSLQSNVTFHKAYDPKGPPAAMTLADATNYILGNFGSVAEVSFLLAGGGRAGPR